MAKSTAKSKRAKSRAHITVYVSHGIRRKLMIALKKRSKIAALNGLTPPTSFSAWIREKAYETIVAFQ